MTATPIIIFTDCQTSRLTYVLNFLFKDKGETFSVISDKREISSHQIHIAYSNKPIENANIWIQPSGLLEESKINSNWQITFDNKLNVWHINQQRDELAIIFYFLSRYEEYVDQNRDSFGRFTAKQSVLHQNNQLSTPWCDLIVKNIWEQLSLNYELVAKRHQTILTYDIDIAWAYKYKPLWRNVVNIIKEVPTPKNLLERMKVLLGKKNDPYDHYKMIKKNADRHQTILFFLLGNYSKFDKNHFWKNKKLQSLIEDFNGTSEIGIHPSFRSFLNSDLMMKEIKRLETICKHPIKKSRQHFLRMTLPASYQLLEKNGISFDYTMGYAEHCGFRAGTSFPFTFYDLEENSAKNLKIVPFTFMDGTFKDYMGLKPEDAISIIIEFKKIIKTVGGQFIPLWHNHSIGNTKEWKGWQKVYETCLN